MEERDGGTADRGETEEEGKNEGGFMAIVIERTARGWAESVEERAERGTA